MPPCEPLSIPEIRIKQNAGAIRMESVYTDVAISGLSNFTVRKVHADPSTGDLHIDFWFPLLKMASNYYLNGKVLLMPLSGNGTAIGNFSKFNKFFFCLEFRNLHFFFLLADVDATVGMKHKMTRDNNVKQWSVDDVNVEFNIGDASVQLDNLFNG